MSLMIGDEQQTLFLHNLAALLTVCRAFQTLILSALSIDSRDIVICGV